ncbi:CD2 antigen cytoplasmic tail-binding protein 2 homolog [Argiope bruennichi]|uniref:CD2 antigen cytoplasmic tail-binding protein like n=1 Tax=Argiope bruennichi TaxID=94029 RepID=A0A8T0E046_ARGBR|nr:CD2 antigen cytoplasmic tail-binding protein 2 homolog [Argiope bruennichi]KAF8763321.1 CD2 antigen cytoplasmic tail-binding protein like [Argiope bruennichi]
MDNKIFNHEELEAEIQREKDDRTEELSYKKSKHSLDSDEEDDDVKAQKYNILDPNELEGQEEGTIDYDGDIKITPFNMKEELEEGYFDKEGTYIFQKEEEIKDQWLDDIDWIKVKAIESTKRKTEDEEDSDEDERPPIDLADKYKQMLELMKPGETVQKAICRLGGTKSSKSVGSRWKKKKESDSMDTNEESEKDVEKLQLLTGLADEIVHSGDMDIYQQTYEKMVFHVNSKSKTGANGILNTDAELDMFGDDFDEKVDDKIAMPPPRTPTPSEDVVNPTSEVMWEFKWEDKEDAKVYGPYPTSQMQQWVDEKYFENGVFVRQCGKQDTSFYNSKRIDFELYL